MPDAVLDTDILTKSSHQPSEETPLFLFYRNTDSSGSVLDTGAVDECDTVWSGAKDVTLLTTQGDGGHGSSKSLNSAAEQRKGTDVWGWAGQEERGHRTLSIGEDPRAAFK